MPWLAAYTGCRQAELGGLRVEDVREEQGIAYLDLKPTADRRLRNRGSARRIPVHPVLIERGFVEYVKAQPKEGLLFSELRPGPHGVLTGAFSFTATGTRSRPHVAKPGSVKRRMTT